MPLTFLAHQAPVLPLKIGWPHLVDGTALVVGSMMPDLLFLTYGTPLYLDAHRVGPQVWLCLPLTVILTMAIKRMVAGPLGAALPDAGRFHLRDYARLSTWPIPRSPRAWLVLVASALVGSLSHLVLDSFTHSWGFVVEHVAALRAVAFHAPPTLATILGTDTIRVYELLQIGLSIVGAAVTVWLLFLIGRARRLHEWYPDAVVGRATPTSRRRLALGAVVGAALGATISLAGWAAGTSHGLLFIVVDAAGCGLILTGRWSSAAMVDPGHVPPER